MNIGVMGCGTVGSSIAHSRFYGEEGVKVVVHDPPLGLLRAADLYDCRVVFVCVPTYTNEEGRQVETHIRDAFSTLRDIGYGGAVVVKSTVLPGTTLALREEYKLHPVVHSPEFLSDRTNEEDFKKTTNGLEVTFLGGLGAHDVGLLLKRIWPRLNIVNFDSRYGSTVTEMIKYAANCFYATKVAYFNEIYRMCQKEHISFNDVKRGAIRSRHWIGPMHTDVPGPDNRLGFGGKCFPKDLRALAEKYGSWWLKGTYEVNREHRKGIPIGKKKCMEKGSAECGKREGAEKEHPGCRGGNGGCDGGVMGKGCTCGDHGGHEGTG